MSTMNANYLPSELWLMIVNRIKAHPDPQDRWKALPTLGHLSLTNRLLQAIVQPILDDEIKAVYNLELAEEEPDLSTGGDKVITMLCAIGQCPMLAYRIRKLPVGMTVLGRPMRYFRDTNLEEMRAPITKVLRYVGIKDKIDKGVCIDDYLAFLLLILPKLEEITWTGMGYVRMASPLRRIVSIAKSQTPQRSFVSLRSVSMKVSPVSIPDTLFWDFLTLPSVEAIRGPALQSHMADLVRISPNFEHIEVFTSSKCQSMPIHCLGERLDHMTNVRSFKYHYSLYHSGGFLQATTLATALKKLHHSLEELSIEPLRVSTSFRSSGRSSTSPHMWNRLAYQTVPGNLVDAGWLLGSLTSFERLRVIRASRIALYDPRFVLALKRLLPSSLEHLDVSPGPKPHKLDAGMLSTQLVAVVRSKPERFPKFAKLTLGDHTVLLTPLLKAICQKFEVAIDFSPTEIEAAPVVGKEAFLNGLGNRRSLNVVVNTLRS